MHFAISLAFRSLLDWPTGLHQLIDAHIFIRNQLYETDKIVELLSGRWSSMERSEYYKDLPHIGTYGEMGTLFSSNCSGLDLNLPSR